MNVPDEVVLIVLLVMSSTVWMCVEGPDLPGRAVAVTLLCSLCSPSCSVARPLCRTVHSISCVFVQLGRVFPDRTNQNRGPAGEKGIHPAVCVFLFSYCFIFYRSDVVVLTWFCPARPARPLPSGLSSCEAPSPSCPPSAASVPPRWRRSQVVVRPCDDHVTTM